ncbi:uridine kinase [Propionispira arboris]|uniref:Uridine kinase n=1 Tax=Propionispira arboris TaxID=84035 RepID=A0A1H6XGV2_9FIRM|nr:nucleoside kinase [Propionispira arboris]SEJ25917.1 uridine kinase [Propionispira arboris]
MQEIIDEIKRTDKIYSETMKLEEISRDFQQFHQAPIVAAKIDNILKALQSPIGQYQSLVFVDMTSEDGIKVYRRSVMFLLIIAIHELFEDADLIVEHSINKGLYCEVHGDKFLNERDIETIEQRMRKIVAEKREINKKTLSKADAVRLFKQTGQIEKANLIASLQQETVSIYCCGEFYDYLYGPMLPSTASLDLFAIDYYKPGLIVRTPERDDPTQVSELLEQSKLAAVFSEAQNWAKILHCDYVSDLNRYNKNKMMGDIIRISEALHEKKIGQIADFITGNIQKIRLILIAGPSSSGKTTFAQRLRIQLRVNGIEPISISLDDYFLDRNFTPRNEKGEYDFEALGALDVELFNQHLLKLLAGDTVEIPHYNFVTGKREWHNHLLQVGETQPIILEGIHGLNEELTKSIERAAKFKIYISALTQMAIDGHNRIPTTDARLIRRMVRDHQSRGAYALKTIKQWPDVRAGEEKNIFPYQEEADVMFNSALIYELSILKKYATPLLEKVSHDVPEYSEAIRLLDFLEYFNDVYAEEDIPNNSILREFIGKSCFSVG